MSSLLLTSLVIAAALSVYDGRFSSLCNTILSRKLNPITSVIRYYIQSGAPDCNSVCTTRVSQTTGKQILFFRHNNKNRTYHYHSPELMKLLEKNNV